MGQLLDTSTPQQVRQRVEVPDVKLVVQWATEAHANEVTGEQNQHNLWFSDKDKKKACLEDHMKKIC